MNLNGLPVLGGLLKYAGEHNIPFHMPGHKENVNGFEELEAIQRALFDIDKTEVEGLDNLHGPEGIILEGQRAAAKAFNAKKSYFLVNGSTCGIYSMILGTTKPGDKIIVQRNCHRAVFMAILMGDLNAVYIDPEIIEDFLIPGGVELSKLSGIFDAHPDAKAVVLTNPSYYGVCSDMEVIVKLAHERNILVLVDEAHGAHLPFNKNLPKSAMEYGADAAVVSVHKSLPALTQASLLNIGTDIDDSGIRFMLRIFQSTSPSYVLMASIDAARYIMESRGETLLNGLIDNINGFSSRLEELKSFRLLDRSVIGKSGVKDIDITKLVIGSSLGGKDLERILRKNHIIQVEMSDINNIVLICSIGDSNNSFEKLLKALYNIGKEHKDKHMGSLHFMPIKYETRINMKSAYYGNKRSVRLKESAGLISGETVVPYPPGIPILLPGELITSEIIDYIGFLKERGIRVTGMEDETGEEIRVVEL